MEWTKTKDYNPIITAGRVYASSCGSSCGASDEEPSSACGSSCGASDDEETPDQEQDDWLI